MKILILTTSAVLFVFAFSLVFVGPVHAGMCSDEAIASYLDAPVEDTLANTRVVYAADSNFKVLVASADRPLMVLIFNNDQDFSKGLAAVATCVLAEFPQIKFIAYDVRELNQAEVDKAAFFTSGMAETVPSLFIYKYVDGGLELAGSIKEGYNETELVKKQIVRLSNFIWDKVLR